MKTRSIPIEDLKFDIRNPRIASASNQQEAIGELWSRNLNHIVGLALHIAQHGLNPSDHLYVVEEDAEYVVVEGNRRLLAVRALNDLTLIPSEDGQNKIRSAKARFKYRDVESLDCDVYGARAEVDLWIDLKHQGVGEGEGTVEWNSEQKYRRRVARGGRRTFGHELWWWAETAFSGDQKLADLIKKGKADQWTLMDRLAKDKFRKSFGFTMTPSGVESTRPNEQLEPVFRKIMTDIDDETLRARTIETQKERDAYIVSTLIPLLGETLDIPASPTLGSGATENPGVKDNDRVIATCPAGREETAESDQSAPTLEPGAQEDPVPHKPKSEPTAAPQVPRRSKSPKLPDDADFIFPGLRWNELPSRIPHFVYQAQQVSISGTPEVAGVCVRVLLDLLVDHFFLAHKTLRSKGKLEADLRTIMGEAQKRTSVSEREAPWKSARDSLEQFQSSLNGLVSSAHGFVHSLGATGGETVVRDITRQLRPLVSFMVDFIIENPAVAATK